MVRRWPFLIPFLLMAAGICLSVRSGCYCNPVTLTAVFSCLLLSSLLTDSRLFTAFTALFFFLWGMSSLHPWLAPESSSRAILAHISDTPITVEGIISARPLVTTDGSRLIIETEHALVDGRIEAVSGRLLLYVSRGDVTLNRGDRIRFITRVSAPHRLGLPGEFDYPRYLAFQKISATGRVASQEEIVCMRAAAVESWQRSVDLVARRFGDIIRASVADEKSSSVLTALLLGDQGRIPHDLADAYTRAGVNHILSISGFHIGIIAAFITMLVMWLMSMSEYLALRWNIHRIAVSIAVPAMLGYLFLTGSAPATTRSVIMLTVFALALFAERERDAVNTLLLAAFFLVAINPPTLFDVSFQLSFLSLWGIIVAVPLIMKHCSSVTSLRLRSAIQFVAASVAASCVTLVPVLYIFNVASLNGILTNFVIVPLLGYGAVIAGFIALPLIMVFPAASPVLLWPAAELVSISNTIIVWCRSLPVLSFYGITGLDMLFFLLFMISVTFVRNKRVLACLLVLLPLAAAAQHMYVATERDGHLHITVLSVGQAESILVRLPDGSTLLVDGGGYLYDTGNDFGQRMLAPALGALHVGRIDRMVATHSHPDHSGGLPFVIRHFPVGEFWSGTDISPDVQKELGAMQVPQKTLAAGDVRVLPGSVTLTVLSPVKGARPDSDGAEASVNEQSLVFRLRYGSFSMLFCADAGHESERSMIARNGELHSTVLKVGHHGSRFSTSREFLKRVNPELAVISAGAGNRFGLPSPKTVELLKTEKIPLYRTDRDGTIEIVTDGRCWTVSSSRKPD